MASLPPKEALEQYLARHAKAPDRELIPVPGGPLPMRRRQGIVLMLLALAGVEWAVWTHIPPTFGRTAGQADGYSLLSPTGLGLSVSILAVAVVIAAAVLLFTDVDSKGIHRPDWAGGAFIPWSSVTEVSVGASPEFLRVRAGSEQVTLNLRLFVHPPEVIALIRRYVPAERLKHI